MKRREFLTGGFPALASLPLIGGLFNSTKATEPVNNALETIPFNKKSIFDSAELNRLVKESLNSPKVSARNLIFEQRTPTIDYEDLSKVISLSGSISTADVISDESEGIVYDLVGTKEFSNLSTPNIKIGNTVSESLIKREHKRTQESEVNPDTEKLMNDWLNTLADDIATGIRSRKNSLIINFMLGAEDFNTFGVKLLLNMGIPKGVHSTLTQKQFETRPLASIRKHLRYMKSEHGVTYDRITLGTNTFRQIVARAENKKIRGKGSPKEWLEKNLKLKIELYDGLFYEKRSNGVRAHERYMPENRILFSNTKNDNNPEVIHFGNTVTVESEISGLINHQEAEYGPFSYFSTPPDGSSMIAWGVIKGIPVLKDKTAFSSLRIE